jgi:hypothetical protein
MKTCKYLMLLIIFFTFLDFGNGQVKLILDRKGTDTKQPRKFPSQDIEKSSVAPSGDAGDFEAVPMPPQPPSPTPPESKTSAASSGGSKTKPKPKPNAVAVAVAVPINDSVLVAYNKSQTAYYDFVNNSNKQGKIMQDSILAYNLWALDNTKSLIEAQHWKGEVIFWLVVFILLIGLGMSIVQFRPLLKNIRSGKQSDQTTFKASLTGFEISTSIVGLVMLTISLAFFYLYLINVFPIETLK